LRANDIQIFVKKLALAHITLQQLGTDQFEASMTAAVTLISPEPAVRGQALVH